MEDPVTAVEGLEATSPEEGHHLISGRFLFNINFVFVSSLTSNTIGFVVVILLARALGPEGRGVMALYQAAVNIGFALLNLGIGTALFYFLARREISGRRAVETGATVTILTAAVTAVAVLVTALFFASRFEDRHVPYALAVLAVPALVQLRVVGSVLRARGRFGALNALEVALPVSMFACFGAVELMAGLSVGGAVWAWSLTFLAPLALGYALMGTGAWPRRVAPIASIGRILRFGGQSQLTALVQLMNYRVDTFLILLFVNTAGVGLYTVAISQTEGLWILADSVVVVLLTNITAGDAANAARMTPVVCRNTLLVTGMAAIVAALIAGLWIPVVFGQSYQGSVVPYLWLLPGTVAFAGSKVLAAYVISRGRPIVNAWIAIGTFAASVPSTTLLTYFYGVSGAAAGTSLGYIVNLALTTAAYRRLSGEPVLRALLADRSDVRLYAGLAASIARRLWRRRPTAAATPRDPFDRT